MRADLHHFTSESINRHVQKIIPYSDEFVRQHAAAGRRSGVFDLAVRPVWRFWRAYFLRLGFLDGWPGYYIAWLNAFATVTRYTKIREARLDSPQPPAGSGLPETDGVHPDPEPRSAPGPTMKSRAP